MSEVLIGIFSLRDLTYTVWVESGKPMSGGRGGGNPIDSKTPGYNPATGTAPPPVPSQN